MVDYVKDRAYLTLNDLSLVKEGADFDKAVESLNLLAEALLNGEQVDFVRRNDFLGDQSYRKDFTGKSTPDQTIEERTFIARFYDAVASSEESNRELRGIKSRNPGIMGYGLFYYLN